MLFNLTKLKQKLIEPPILSYPNFAEPFILTTDASNYTLGAVLSQGKIGDDKPIAYASKSLNKHELRVGLMVFIKRGTTNTSSQRSGKSF